MTKWKCELNGHCSPPFFFHLTLLISILVPRYHLCACRLFCLLQNVSFALCSSWVEKCCWKLNVAASSSATSGQCLLVISLLSPCRWSFPQWPEPDTFWCCLSSLDLTDVCVLSCGENVALFSSSAIDPSRLNYSSLKWDEITTVVRCTFDFSLSSWMLIHLYTVTGCITTEGTAFGRLFF